MNKRELDAHITGRYGEDQMDDVRDFESLVNAAQGAADLIKRWRETGVQPKYSEFQSIQDELEKALSKY